MIQTLLFAGGFIIFFGEALAMMFVVLIGLAFGVQTKKLSPAWLVGWAPLSFVAIILSQQPWNVGEEMRILSKRTYGPMTLAVTQYNDGLTECNTQLWCQDERGKWSGYLIDNDNVRWSSAGFRYVSSNRIDVTRWGLVLGSLDPMSKRFCLISSDVEFEPFASSEGHP